MLIMKRTVTFAATMLLGVATLHAASDWPSIYGPRRNHTSDQKGLVADMATGRSEGALDNPARRRFRRSGRPAMARCTCWTGMRRWATRCVCFDLASGKELWTFAYDAPGSFMFAGSRTTPTRRRRARLHRRTDGGPVRHQHQDTQARLAQEHLEGLRRRRRIAAMGDRAESVDLRRSADRRASDARGRRRRLRQDDRRAQMEVGSRCPAFPGYVTPADRQDCRRRPAGHDHRRPSDVAVTPGTAASTASIRAAAKCCGPTPTGSASSRFRRPSMPAKAACSSRAPMAQARAMIKVEKKADGTLRRFRAVQESRLRRPHPAAGSL